MRIVIGAIAGFFLAAGALSQDVPRPALRATVDNVCNAYAADKISRHIDALGGLSRVTFRMGVAGLSHAKLMKAIDLIAAHVRPRLRGTRVA